MHAVCILSQLLQVFGIKVFAHQVHRHSANTGASHKGPVISKRLHEKMRAILVCTAGYQHVLADTTYALTLGSTLSPDTCPLRRREKVTRSEGGHAAAAAMKVCLKEKHHPFGFQN